MTQSKFRTKDKNIPLIEELFFEYAKLEGRPYALYSVYPFDRSDESGRTFIGLAKVYVDMADTSEYSFAMKYFESWDHWLKVRNNVRINPHVEKWSKELEHKLRKEAFDRIKEMAENGSLEANKFIVNANFVDGIPEKVLRNGKMSANRPVGRPKTATATTEEILEKEEKNQVLNDLKRLGLVN